MTRTDSLSIIHDHYVFDGLELLALALADASDDALAELAQACMDNDPAETVVAQQAIRRAERTVIDSAVL